MNVPAAADAPAELTDAQIIVLLSQQLAGAITHLRAKDATEEALAQRFERLYAQRFETMRSEMERFKLKYGPLIKRYELLRMHIVRVRSLNITATGEHLDRLLDGLLQHSGNQVPQIQLAQQRRRTRARRH